MRYFVAIVLAFVGMACLLGAESKPAANKERVEFDGQTLVFAFEGENPGESFREYIPKEEKLDSWTRLASIREYPKLDDPKRVATNLLRALKQQNPQAPSSIVENTKTGEVIVDFVTWPADGSFVEFNVFKYGKKERGGLMAQQYALREYVNKTTFLKRLKPVRERLVNLMVKEGLHLVK